MRCINALSVIIMALFLNATAYGAEQTDAGRYPDNPVVFESHPGWFTASHTADATQWGENAHTGELYGCDIYYQVTLPERMSLIVHTFGSELLCTRIELYGPGYSTVFRARDKREYYNYCLENHLYDGLPVEITQDCFVAFDLPPGTYDIRSAGFRAYNANAVNGPITTTVIGFSDDSRGYRYVPDSFIPGTATHPFPLSRWKNDFRFEVTDSFSRDFYHIREFISPGVYYQMELIEKSHLIFDTRSTPSEVTVISDSMTIGPFRSDSIKVNYCPAGIYTIYFKPNADRRYVFTVSGEEIPLPVPPPKYPPYEKEIKLTAQGVTGKNYVATRTMLDESGQDFTEVVEHVDGLGRPVQTVLKNASPAGGDIVSRQDYDTVGRPYRSWLPALATTDSESGYAEVSALDYTSAYGNDNRPYSITIYESSTLERPIQQFGPGERWVLDNKAISSEYLINNSGQGELGCIFITVSDTPDAPNTPVKVICGSTGKGLYYNQGELTVLRTTSEDGGVTLSFTDCAGREVLSRRIVDGSFADTYYVYDSYGNLTAVLPPEASTRISGVNEMVSGVSEILDQYCYVYTYDHHGQMLSKRLPGCDPVLYRYDGSGRCILTQDGELRRKGKWRFSIGDVFGRECISGICLDGSSVDEFRTTRARRISNGDDVPSGYDHSMCGYVIYGARLVGANVLTATYYDDYSFVGARGVPGMPGEDVLGFEGRGGFGSPYPSAKGHVTGSVVAVGEPSDTAAVYLYTAMYYDDRDREIFRASTNAIGGTDRLWTAYDFTGNVTATCRTHTSQLAAEVSHTERYRHEYDRMGRQLATWHSIDGADEVQLSAMDYDAVGRLASERSGGDVPFLSREYTYNIRGWLTSSVADGYTEHLTYTHGGNVSRLKWRALFGTERWYDCSYDALDRLTGAVYGDSEGGSGRMDTSYGYDLNGNMTSLMRVGMYSRDMFGVKYGTIDDVTLEYSGNRLLRATDAMGTSPVYKDAFHFTDGTDESVEYTYDSNGNQSADLNRGILSTAYDINNRPRSVRFSSGARTDYLYDATGTKLRTVHTIPSVPPAVPMEGGTDDESIVSTTDYSGGYIYEDGTVDRLLTTNGFVTFAADGTPEYHYYLKDYLGNVRAVISHDGSVEQTAHYYPFGSLMATTEYQPEVTHPNRHLYGGKELDRTSGLDLLDFEARAYDPLLPRFRSMDPLCEDFTHISPYTYCLNNPFRNIDPTGMRVEFAEGVSDDLKEAFYAACEYLTQNGASEMVDFILNCEEVITIDTGTKLKSNGEEYKNSFDGDSFTIYWLHDVLVVTEEAYGLSPAETLSHEADHAKRYIHEPEAMLRDKEVKIEPYGNLEEKRVMTGSEISVARKLGRLPEGAITRKRHFGIGWEKHKVNATFDDLHAPTE